MAEILMPDGSPAGKDETEAKIHVDDDWKAEAQREKQRLSEEAKAHEEAARQWPAADLMGLINSLAMQAVYAMGGMEDPRSKQRIVDLGMARFQIDMLAVIEKKTEGNRTEEESQLLEDALANLRMSYVQLVKAVKAQGAQVPPEAEMPEPEAPTADTGGKDA